MNDQGATYDAFWRVKDTLVVERGFMYEYSNGITIADDGERPLIMREGKMTSGWDTK